MCGGEVRPADQVVIDQFIVDHPGVTVNMEAVEWGTCQDKSMQLAAAGDPPSIAYMGSRTLRQLANNDLIVPVTFTPEEVANYQPGVLATVTSDGQYWGIPHAFSTKALYINCDVVEAAGAECVAPTTWAELVTLAAAVTDGSDAAGIGIAGKDFDNTMHMFLDFLYSNDGPCGIGTIIWLIVSVCWPRPHGPFTYIAICPSLNRSFIWSRSHSVGPDSI